MNRQNQLKSGRQVPFLIAVFLLAACLFTPCQAERAAWTTSRIQGAPTAPLPYTTERVFGEHQFNHPVTLTNAPGTDSMFLLEQHGKVYELESEATDQPKLIGEFSKHVDGLRATYGLAFHPKFEQNREIYVCYIRDGDRDEGTVVSRFRLTKSAPLQIEPNSEEILYTWLRDGHNGGCVKFGPDGYLYVTAGDAAAPFPPDPMKAGQDVSNLLSTIMRIDVDTRRDERLYGIPKDNPFVNLAGARPEIFAYGFRNPWRMAFDRETGDLWVGDVGWELWEMIYAVESGGNYGWSIVEGPHSLDQDGKRGPTPILKPAASHSHTEARSITGGQVYYGDRLPELRGAYIYGDHVTGRIWMLRKHGDTFEGPTEIARSPLQIICFGLHHNGEVYIVDYVGSIHRLVERQSDKTNERFPVVLSDSGLFSDVKNHQLATGVLPYSVIAEPWMDGATAKRFIGIPNNGQIGVYRKGGGHANWDGKHRGSWKFPENSVLGKTISLEARRVETQLLHFDGQAWQAYTYIWNADQTDARLADDKTRTVEVELANRKQRWLISNRADCMICHSNANDMLLGFKPNQLRRPLGSEGDQLGYFERIGLFAEKTPKRQVLCDPMDESQNLESRARSYLHLNCAHCHRREGGGAVAMNVVYGQPSEKTGMIDEPPLQGAFGIEDARVIAPSDPYRSVLLYRFSKQGPGHMPKLGGLEVDQRGAELMHDWIASMGDRSNVDELKVNIASIESAANDEAKLIAQLSDLRRSMLTAHALRSGQLSAATRQAVLAASRKLPATAKDLFESFIPIEKRTLRLGSNIEIEQILAVRGDAKRGRQLFHSESLSCKTCHAISVDAERAGPNLTSLQPDRYRRELLLDNILQPSKEISERYRTHIVQTVDGQLITGVAKTVGDTLFLTDVQNKVHTIPVGDIEFRKIADVSIMPDKLLESLTLGQARDLLEFLSTLKTQGGKGGTSGIHEQ